MHNTGQKLIFLEVSTNLSCFLSKIIHVRKFSGWYMTLSFINFSIRELLKSHIITVYSWWIAKIKKIPCQHRGRWGGSFLHSRPDPEPPRYVHIDSWLWRRWKYSKGLFICYAYCKYSILHVLFISRACHKSKRWWPDASPDTLLVLREGPNLLFDLNTCIPVHAFK